MENLLRGQTKAVARRAVKHQKAIKRNLGARVKGAGAN